MNFLIKKKRSSYFLAKINSLPIKGLLSNYLFFLKNPIFCSFFNRYYFQKLNKFDN